MTTVCVLIIDDEPLIRELVKETLAISAYQVLQAADGTEGLELARRDKPGVVLLDMDLGGGQSGLDICHELRALQDPPQVIFLTGAAATQDVEAGLAAGAMAYLTKPFSPLELIERVQAASN